MNDKITENKYRINKFIALSTGISRREADFLIKDKKVKINGNYAELFSQVKGNEEIEIYTKSKWIKIAKDTNKSSILYYKPIFTVTTRSDPEGRKTIYSNLPKMYANFKPAGRLDYMSEGLIVLTTDGDLIYKLTHPSNHTPKSYFVALNKDFNEKEINKMSRGFNLEGYILNPVEVAKITDSKFKINKFLKLNTQMHWYEFTLTEGRNNQIRKMCQYFDKKVLRLIRVKHGDFLLSEKLYNNHYLELD
jgi:23S rRNA pseudouridine2605 synthase